MIVDSTPGSITCQTSDGRKVIFYGEWTLEPKFYISAQDGIYWLSQNSKEAVNPREIGFCLEGLLSDAHQKGWKIVVEQ